MAHYVRTQFTPLYDPICIVLNTPFHKWREIDQNDLISVGRPTPTITICENNRFPYFKKKWYHQYHWLCGSVYLQSLHCWPCLLFGDKRNHWRCDKFEFGKHITFRKHESDKEHKDCQSKLAKFVPFSESVRLNRQCVQFAIESILIMITRRFPFLEVDKDQTGTHADFVALAVSSTNDRTLKEHFRKTSIGLVLKTTTQTAIIESIADCIDDYIFNLVKASRFFSIRIDDGLNERNECAIFIRIIDFNHQLKEFFLGYFRIENSKNSLSILRIIDTIIQKYEYKSKLVGISYDISCVKFNYLKDLRLGLNFMAQQAIHVNLLGHSIDYMLERCLCSITTCRNFFSQVTSLFILVRDLFKKQYFNDSSLWHDVALLQDNCCSKAKILIAILNNESYASLKDVLEQVQRSDIFPGEILRGASIILNKLKDFGFILLTVIFNQIFLMTSKLESDIRASVTDAKQCQKSVKDTCVTLYQIRNESFFNYLQNSAIRLLQKHYSAEVLSEVRDGNNYKFLFYEILDNVIMELHTRYENYDQYEFFNLDNSLNFNLNPSSLATNDIAMKLINNLTTHFPLEFPNKDELKRDWLEVAVRKRFYYMSLTEILAIVHDPCRPFNNLYKLFSLIILLRPLDKKCGTMCLHKIKPYLEKSVSPEMRPAMAKILMNQEVFSALNGLYSFRDDILDKLSDRYSAIKLSNKVKVLNKPDNKTNSVPTGLVPNSFASTCTSSTTALGSNMDPAAFITPDIPGLLSEAGLSNRVEPDSLMNDNLTLNMTCEKFQVSDDHSLRTDIKQEPLDSSSILSATLDQELNNISQETPSGISSGGSLFQAPVLIKEEIVSSEEEL